MKECSCHFSLSTSFNHCSKEHFLFIKIHIRILPPIKLDASLHPCQKKRGGKSGKKPDKHVSGKEKKGADLQGVCMCSRAPAQGSSNQPCSAEQGVLFCVGQREMWKIKSLFLWNLHFQGLYSKKRLDV